MRSTCLVASIVLAVALQSLGNMPLYAQDNAKDKTSPVEVTELYKTNLADVPGKEARILQLEIAPVHTSDGTIIREMRARTYKKARWCWYPGGKRRLR